MRAALEQFYTQKRFRGKGPLSIALVVTEAAKSQSLPLNQDDFLAASGGQVRGAGKAAVQTILARHDIERVLSQEAGRTSRGSILNMREYVNFLNTQHALGVAIDWEEVEAFWVGKVRDFFAGAPFKLTVDASQSVRAIVRGLTAQAIKRQKDMPGVMFLGTMMQHLVGAKLQVILGIETVSHHCSNQNDTDASRTGDFDLGDVTIHVTSSPTESLLRKCADNLSDDLRPIIVTTGKGVTTAEVLAENIGIADRVDIIDFDQFIATNIHEHSQFVRSARRSRIEELIACYNTIIDSVETDPSLKIAVSSSR